MMENPVVEISNGKVQGFMSETLDGEKFYNFLGIPYGKPPIGELRFKAPEPVGKWTGVKICTERGPKSFQKDQFSTEVVGSEDCLHLNVFTTKLPDTNFKLKPVIAFIFGGKFLFGSNDPEELGPEFLLSEDIVLVIPNYRLGIFGFLQLEDHSLGVPGNAGLKDQVLALQWIQNNIKQFGGDPNNVTLAGHSAGAVAVHHHLFSDASKGLFQKVVMMSGSVVADYVKKKTFDLRTFIDVLNIKLDTEREVLQHLQNLAPESIIDLQQKYLKLYEFRGIIFGPVVEKPNRNAFLTEDPLELLLNGKFHKTPTLISYTNMERLAYVKEQQQQQKPSGENKFLSDEPEDVIPPILKHKIDDINFQMISSEFKKIYSSNNFLEKICSMLSDAAFIMPLIATAQTHAVFCDRPVYLMRWSVNDVLNFTKKLHNSHDLEGCSHADEIGYIFMNGALPKPTKGSRAYETVKTFAKIMTNFCTNGNPSTHFTWNWQPLQSDSTTVLDIGQGFDVKRFPEEKRMRLWQKIFEFDKRNTNLNFLKVV